MLKDLLAYLLSRPFRRPAEAPARAAATADAVALRAQAELAHREGNLERAAVLYRRVLAVAPGLPGAHHALGRVLRQAGARDDAIIQLRRAYAQSPQAPGVLRDLVTTLVEADLGEKALALAHEARTRNPTSYEANLCAGLAHEKLHQPQAALAAYEAALVLRRDDPDLHDLRGLALQQLGRVEEAIADYDRALALDPEHRHAGFHRAMARLLLGDFAGGWEGYERRLASVPRVPSGLPRWDGEPLGGKTLLVHREQGLGDEIMFASLLPQVIEAAGQCIVECDPRLVPLFRRSFPRATVFGAIPGGALPAPIAGRAIDCEIAAGSVAGFLRRDRSQFRDGPPYLRADPGRVQLWRERLAQLGPGLKVGLSWTGGVRKTRRALRSIPLSHLQPVLQVPQARFVSLQYTPGAAQEIATAGARIEHWPQAIEDFDEKAALVCALDVVVSVCTTVVHLGGALGVPVLVMAPHSPEWRYGLRGGTMPWYGSVKLFRQPASGDWASVLQSVAAELRRR